MRFLHLLKNKIKLFKREEASTNPEKTSKSVSDFLNKYRSTLKSIPEKTSTSFFKPSLLRVGIIADEFNLEYLEDALELTYLNLDNYQKAIDSGTLDCILFMSPWRGKKPADAPEAPESYDYDGKNGLETFHAILSYAKQAHIPIVYQSIEDPPSYERFAPFSDYAQAIFTSAEELIPEYIARNNNQNVWEGEYGINPLLHHPTGFIQKTASPDAVFFAGAWYRRFKNRCRDARMIFNGVLKNNPNGLLIANRRSYDKNIEKWSFPKKYLPSTMPLLPYRELQKAHKLYNWAINLNSVTTSKTMCARRVYEIQALGSLIISNYSPAVASRFPGIFTVFESSEIPRILNGYTQREIVDMQIEGIRDIFSNCTVYNRLERMFSLSGIEYKAASPPIYVVYSCSDSEIKQQIDRQSFKEVHLVKKEDSDHLAKKDWGLAVEYSDKFSNRHHLMDMVNAFKFTDVDFVYYIDEDNWKRAYTYHELSEIPAGAMVDLSRLELSDLHDTADHPYKGFAVLAPNRGRDTSGTKKQIAVIVPYIHDANGLEKRCIRSLMRSSIFPAMQIILCIPEDLDEEALHAVQDLGRDFDNITICKTSKNNLEQNILPKIGEMSPYVAFLDSSNEAIGDGYASLVQELEANKCDFAFGKYIVASNGATPEGITDIQGPLKTRVLEDEPTGNPSTQACVFRKELLTQVSFHDLASPEWDEIIFNMALGKFRSAFSSDDTVFVNYAQD